MAVDLHAFAQNSLAEVLEPAWPARGAPGCVLSRRDSCSTFSMIVLHAVGVAADDLGEPLVLVARAAADSASSCAAWLMAPTGLRISCAMLAESRPSAASLDCCTFSRRGSVSSRNTSTGAGLDAAERREVGPDHAAAVGGDEGLRRASGAAVVLAPGREQVQQPRRGFAEQRARIGAAVAEHLRRRSR